MNPEPQIRETQTSVDLPQFPLPPTENQNGGTAADGMTGSDRSTSLVFKPGGRKPTGKIAQLPRAQRDIINQMLDDGATYDAIETEMAKHGVSLNGENISNWFQNGFQQYLQHQDYLAEMRLLRENASDLVQDYNVVEFHQAANQLAVGRIFKALNQQQLIDDPTNYIRTLNALARLSRAALVLKQYEDENTKTAAHTTKSNNPTDPQTQAKLILSIMEKGFGCKAADAPIGFPPPNPDSNPSSREVAPKSDPTSSTCPSGPSNPISPLPSRPCRGETPEPCRRRREETQTNDQPEQPATIDTEHPASAHSSIENQNSKFKNPAVEHCLDCGSLLPPVPPHSLRRPEDHCPNPNCGMRLPDIGLCYQPGFDRCLNCGATQPALLPGGERPRPACHKCGIRLHNPELPRA